MAGLAELRRALRRIANDEMQDDPAHDTGHLDRVWTNADTIQRAMGQGSRRVLLAAAYLHDLVNLAKDHPERATASRRSADKAAGILPGLGYDQEETERVFAAIVSHSHSAGVEPASIEAQILRDADRLDALGAIGLARVFAVSGALGRAFYDPDDPFADTRPVDDQCWALDHFKAKLLVLQEGMLTPEGARIAKRRTDYLREYLGTLREEIAGSAAV